MKYKTEEVKWRFKEESGLPASPGYRHTREGASTLFLAMNKMLSAHADSSIKRFICSTQSTKLGSGHADDVQIP